MSVEIKPVQQESIIFQCYLVCTRQRVLSSANKVKYWTLVECLTSTVIFLFADLRVCEFTMSGYLCPVEVFYTTSAANGV